MAKFLDKAGVTTLWKRIRNALGGVLVDATSGGDMVSVSKVAADGVTQVQGVSFDIDFYDYNDNRIPVIVKGDLKFDPASSAASGMLMPADYLKLSELTRPSAGTIAMKKLRTQYLAFATDGTNEIGGLFIEDGHTMIQAKQGTPIKLGWRGGNVGFCMDSNGHAGIGYATDGNLPTIDTTARLTVDGDLRVLGKVIADEQQAPLGTVGNPHPLTTDSDLNDIKEGGWYYFDKYNQSTMPANTPPSVNASFSLLVTPQCNNVGGTITYPGNYQILFMYKIFGSAMTSSFFIRLLTTNGIKTWQKLDLTSLFTPDE